jgi:hypothetical protein
MSSGLSLSTLIPDVHSHANGQASHLFPNVGSLFAGNSSQPVSQLNYVKVDSGDPENRTIQWLMDNSILVNRHDSFKKYPYTSFSFDSVLRLENSDRWDQWQKKSTDPNNSRQWRYFFHATSLGRTRAIEKRCFKQSLNGDWGPGIYLSENSSVSHLFAMDKVKCPAGCGRMKYNKNGNNVKCTECSATNIETHSWFGCSKCSKALCRSCADKNVNADGWCYMLLCIVNVGVIKSYDEYTSLASRLRRLLLFGGNVNTVECNCLKGYKEYVLKDAGRVYPCYRIKYKTNVAAGMP